MSKITTFLILSSLFLTCRNTSRACVPNSQSIVDGKTCQCNNDGQWTEANCNENNHSTDRKQGCQPGQIVFQGCSHCVCKENETLTCNEKDCQQDQNAQESLSVDLPWCSPYKTYYINCNLCVCPASGKSSEAKCVVDISCNTFNSDSTRSSSISLKIDTCIPKVMYIFPCIHCLCSEQGLLFLDKCFETCVKRDATELTRRCIPHTLYRKGCIVCRCPDNGFLDDKLCTNYSSCTGLNNFSDLVYPSPATFLNCTPNRFTNPRCIYCDCNHDGVIDKSNCLALDCLHSEDINFNIIRETCNPGEIVPFCTECLCSGEAVPNLKYCSKVCSDQAKFNVLHKVINGDLPNILDKTILETLSDNDKCEPNSIYFNLGKYCICPKTGKPNMVLCTVKEMADEKLNKTNDNTILPIEGSTCEPGTLVEFDCNTCFCTRNGTFDLKWCTYDDCQAKKQIQDLYQSRPISSGSINKTCTPGAISRVNCNYCICPDCGYIDTNYCTKNNCDLIGNVTNNSNNWTCEPLTYYEMDCNMCFCPRDGLKNVAKCTKNICENAILRSDGCTPGNLFSDGCNVCVCPPNGNKADKACTNFTCNDIAPWKKIYQISQNILGNQIVEDATRNLDMCFPGEEFIVGCKLCVCPEMGLRFYATCSTASCDDEGANRNFSDIRSNNNPILFQKLTARREFCTDVNVTEDAKSDITCTAGSMYIIQCQQCICPYIGDIKQYCRPFPNGVYCEEAFPGINFVSMRRKGAVLTKANFTSALLNRATNVTHLHSRYECNEDGKVMDNCFICECDNQVLILEHCFKSNATECNLENMPSFLRDY